MRLPSLRRNSATAGDSSPDKKEESAGSLLRFILTLALLAWAVRSFIVAPFSIPSGSMLPTLYIGDYLLVAKWPYGYSRYSLMFGFPPFDGRLLSRLPERGDVVVFRHPTDQIDLIKRVIAVPGDTIEINGGMPILNGKPLTRRKLVSSAVPMTPNSPCKIVPPAAPRVQQQRGGQSCVYPAYRETLPNGVRYTTIDQVEGSADVRPVIRVPEGHLFLMGDNRDDSLDSRFPTTEGGVGLVPVDHLIGRALVTFWSTDGSASYFLPWTWFTALRGNRIGNDYTDSAE